MTLCIESDWNKIAATRRRIAGANNMGENASRIPHVYHVGDKVLICLSSFEQRSQRKIGDPIVKGPYEIVKVNRNGTIRINRGRFEETISIRRVKPFRE